MHEIVFSDQFLSNHVGKGFEMKVKATGISGTKINYFLKKSFRNYQLF